MFVSVHAKSVGHFVSGYESVKGGSLSTIITKRIWSHCLWAGSYREEFAFVGSYYCVLDFDKDKTKDEAKEQLKEFNYLLGPTKSDGLAKEKRGILLPACDRFRVVMRWAEPIHKLDVFRYNMRLVAEQFGADLQACDGARIWQPCKSIDVVHLLGRDVEVIRDIPTAEKDEEKQKKFEKVQNYYENTGTFPGYVMDVLEGKVVHGDINAKLFKACCHLFQRGLSYDYVIEKLEKIPGLSEHSHFQSTVKSAARKVGAC